MSEFEDGLFKVGDEVFHYEGSWIDGLITVTPENILRLNTSESTYFLFSRDGKCVYGC